MPSIAQIWADFGIKNNVRESFKQIQSDLKTACGQISEQLKQAGETAGRSLGDGVKATTGQLQAQMRLIQAQFKQATAQLGLNASEADMLRVKSEALNRQLEVQQQIVQSLNEKYQKAVQLKGENSKEATRLATSLANARATEAEIRNEIQKTNDELQKQTTVAGRVRSAFESVGERLADVGRRMAAAGAAIAGGLALAVKASADFGREMAKVKVLSGATAEEMQALKRAALEVGPSFGISGEAATGAMQQLAASGYTAQQIIETLPAVFSAAAASGEDLTLVTETIASTLQSFGLEASKAGHVADVLAQAANISAIGVEDMAYSLKYAGSVAKSVGIGLEELSAAIAIMGNAGIKGEQAGTTLRAALLRLIDPPKEAKEALDSLGISVTDSAGKMRPLYDIIGQLQKATEGMTDAQKAQVMATIFSTEAVSGMLSVVGAGPEKLKEFTKALQEADGASAKMAQEMRDNLAGSVDALLSSVKALTIALGDQLAPTVRGVADQLNSAAQKFAALDPAMQGIVARAAALAAGIGLAGGSLLIFAGFVPNIVSGLGQLASAAGAAAAVIRGALGGALAFIATPAGAALTIIAGLGALAYVVYQNWRPFKEFFANLWEAVKTDTMARVNAVKDFLANTWAAIKDKTEEVWAAIKQFLADWWPALAGDITGPIGMTAALIYQNWNEISLKTAEIWTAIQNWLAALWTGILAQAKKTWEDMRAFIFSVTDGIKNLFEGLVNSAFNWGRNLMANFIEGFKSLFASLWDALKAAADAVAGFLGFHSPARLGPGRDADKWAPNFVDMFAEGLRAGIPKIEIAVGDLASRMAALSPAVLGPAITNVYNTRTSSSTTSSTVIIEKIEIKGTDAEEVLEKLRRELIKGGIRF